MAGHLPHVIICIIFVVLLGPHSVCYGSEVRAGEDALWRESLVSFIMPGAVEGVIDGGDIAVNVREEEARANGEPTVLDSCGGCVHGTCNDSHFVCDCDQGYYGATCEQKCDCSALICEDGPFGSGTCLCGPVDGFEHNPQLQDSCGVCDGDGSSCAEALQDETTYSSTSSTGALVFITVIFLLPLFTVVCLTVASSQQEARQARERRVRLQQAQTRRREQMRSGITSARDPPIIIGNTRVPSMMTIILPNKSNEAKVYEQRPPNMSPYNNWARVQRWWKSRIAGTASGDTPLPERRSSSRAMIVMMPCERTLELAMAERAGPRGPGGEPRSQQPHGPGRGFVSVNGGSSKSEGEEEECDVIRIVDDNAVKVSGVGSSQCVPALPPMSDEIAKAKSAQVIPQVPPSFDEGGVISCDPSSAMELPGTPKVEPPPCSIAWPILPSNFGVLAKLKNKATQSTRPYESDYIPVVYILSDMHAGAGAGAGERWGQNRQSTQEPAGSCVASEWM